MDSALIRQYHCKWNRRNRANLKWNVSILDWVGTERILGEIRVFYSSLIFNIWLFHPRKTIKFWPKFNVLFNLTTFGRNLMGMNRANSRRNPSIYSSKIVNILLFHPNKIIKLWSRFIVLFNRKTKFGRNRMVMNRANSMRKYNFKTLHYV